ncbi:hypothetical protein [Sphingomonas bisphenolicum]|uniref:Uncharacterized protein n=1 Tax=Sphingomonas bisphenolicum TaxID=296544 RepID=A0ABM7G8I3_9SPHN|nr:hypothetical protein [Sphingomonas bisphenolicum]BBF72433.1 hypothetical protein SBA_pBAR2_650 [Sphingomonas bisphenolicum]
MDIISAFSSGVRHMALSTACALPLIIAASAHSEPIPAKTIKAKSAASEQIGKSAVATIAEVSDEVPRNPFLARSAQSVTHFNPAQTDSLPYTGPTGVFEVSDANIKRIPGGLVNLTVLEASTYPNGEQVVFAANNNRVAKILTTGRSYDLISELKIDGQPYLSSQKIRDIEMAINSYSNNDQKLIEYVNRNFPRYIEDIASRAAIYNVLDNEGTFFTVVNNRIIGIGDSIPGDARSPLKLRRSFTLPLEYMNNHMGHPDAIIGLNMTYDGKIVMATIGGVVAVLDRYFEKPPVIVRLPKGEEITNGIAVDNDGGIYIVSSSAMHKLVWDGSTLHVSGHGAWSSAYNVFKGKIGGVKFGKGSGSTPTLLGFGEDNDKLVVITDGSQVMNLVAFWRDDIPAGFRRRPHTPSRRIADQIKVNFGKDDLKAAQSEQSVVVSGHGAFVVNNTVPHPLPTMLENVLTSGVTRSGPVGAEKFSWSDQQHRWLRDWTNSSVVDASTVPMMSQGSNQVYINGFVDGKWEITGLSWKTGKVVTRVRLGTGQQFNGAYSVTSLLPNGDLVLNGLLGTMRITINKTQP